MLVWVNSDLGTKSAESTGYYGEREHKKTKTNNKILCISFKKCSTFLFRGVLAERLLLAGLSTQGAPTAVVDLCSAIWICGHGSFTRFTRNSWGTAQVIVFKIKRLLSTKKQSTVMSAIAWQQMRAAAVNKGVLELTLTKFNSHPLENDVYEVFK